MPLYFRGGLRQLQLFEVSPSGSGVPSSFHRVYSELVFFAVAAPAVVSGARCEKNFSDWRLNRVAPRRRLFDVYRADVLSNSCVRPSPNCCHPGPAPDDFASDRDGSPSCLRTCMRSTRCSDDADDDDVFQQLHPSRRPLAFGAGRRPPRKNGCSCSWNCSSRWIPRSVAYPWNAPSRYLGRAGARPASLLLLLPRALPNGSRKERSSKYPPC
mmetsp:Transcript_8727/g.21187  ORF Transcript_8727/g.21187 Transcript_8727/m.21187 type:complete len:213 (-) Transcript_8727:657-1295(-)